MRGRGARVGATWPWLLLCLWAALQLAIAWQVNARRQGPIDFLTYQVAAEKIGRGESPYTTATASLAIWRLYHGLEERLRATDAPGRDAIPSRRPPPPPVTPGPYMYPPTLALVPIMPRGSLLDPASRVGRRSSAPALKL